MFYLICFDIVDDRIRQRLVKVLVGHGVRVQKSVFECGGLSDDKFLKLKRKVEDLIDHVQDNVRYYRLCRGCLAEVACSGIGTPPEVDDFRVV